MVNTGKKAFIKIFLFFALFGCANSFVFANIMTVHLKLEDKKKYSVLTALFDTFGCTNGVEDGKASKGCEEEKDVSKSADNDVLHFHLKGLLGLPYLLYLTDYPEYTDNISENTNLDYSIPPER